MFPSGEGGSFTGPPGSHGDSGVIYRLVDSYEHGRLPDYQGSWATGVPWYSGEPNGLISFPEWTPVDCALCEGTPGSLLGRSTPGGIQDTGVPGGKDPGGHSHSGRRWYPRSSNLGLLRIRLWNAKKSPSLLVCTHLYSRNQTVKWEKIGDLFSVTI